MKHIKCSIIDMGVVKKALAGVLVSIKLQLKV